MAEKESIYDRIKGAMTPEGTMPEGFVLREKLQDGRQFADGAIDGTIRYYMGPAGNTDITMLEQALKIASQGRFEDAANALITYFAQGIVMLPVMDKVQEWVYAHPEGLSPDRLGQFARTLLLQSRDVESVKFALTILEVLDSEPDEKMREILLTLAACEEMTLFCLFALGGYEDANRMYFQLAKKLKGWGRIHAVSMLKPEDEEMRDWLLQEGWQNEIMPEYSAITVIKRVKLPELLNHSEEASLLEIAGKLISYSLQDEPIAGLASYKRAGELLQVYLEGCRQSGIGEGAADGIRAIRTFAEQHELANKWQLVELCNNILAE
ncbi:hypothetical protein [Anaerovibrio sp.]|uniref:hypothetical protein n=1 Tax=Anaerovibrio sp. TaxID=1872532 RepID=UPI003F1888AD